MINQEIRDIKLPIDIPSPLAWLWIALAVLAILASMAGLIIWLMKRPKKQEVMETAPVSAWDRAYARLENLKYKNLIDRQYLKPFYTELGDIIRHYLEERFLLKAPEMTTEEFLDSLKNSSVLNESQKGLLKEFLYACDMVKFAKHESDAMEAQKSFDLAKQLVDQTRGI